jgi:hypothetical protein
MINEHPRKIANCRESTDLNTMTDSNFLRFWCRKFNQSKPVSGRKSLGWKAGFECATCAEKSAT